MFNRLPETIISLIYEFLEDYKLNYNKVMCSLLEREFCINDIRRSKKIIMYNKKNTIIPVYFYTDEKIFLKERNLYKKLLSLIVLKEMMNKQTDFSKSNQAELFNLSCKFWISYRLYIQKFL